MAGLPTDAIHDESDVENDSLSPIFDRFYANGGSQTLMEMSNFNFNEIERLWHRCRTVLTQSFMLGRGKKTDVAPKDLLFIVLCVLKAATNWDLMGEIFEKKGPTLQRLFTRAVDVLSPHLLKEYLIHYRNNLTMKKLIKQNLQFKNFPYALYATDVIFQQSNRPSGNLMEGKAYFSGKHKLYGYKTEVSVAPTGYAVDLSEHSKGSISDLTIFRENLEYHRAMLAKHPDEGEIQDHGVLSTKYPANWGVLMDKGYQGASEYVRAIIPKKKPHGKLLPVDDENWNATVSSDRIIVENFFGRLTKLWGVISSKYRWSEEGYDDIFRLCVALTNYHISFHPLRDEEDATNYKQYKNRNYLIGENIAKNASLLKRSIVTGVVGASARKLDVLPTVRSAARALNWF